MNQLTSPKVDSVDLDIAFSEVVKVSSPNLITLLYHSDEQNQLLKIDIPG